MFTLSSYFFSYNNEQAHNNTNGTQFQPHEAQNSTDKPATKFVCACGESGTFPMCDGSHYGLTDERKAVLTAKAEAYKQVPRYHCNITSTSHQPTRPLFILWPSKI